MQKDWKKIFDSNSPCIFDYDYKKTNPQKFGWKREPKLRDSLKKIAKLKENKFTLQQVRLKLHLLNVQYGPRKT